MKVFRAGALTVNAALTFSNRCRGSVQLLDALVMGASGSISMSGKGAVGSSKWAIQDILIPSYIVLSGNKTSPQDFFKWIRKTGYYICDPSLYASPPQGMGDVTADYASWPGRGTSIIFAATRGAKAERYFQGSSQANGAVGGAGTNAPGGGGTGGIYSSGPYSCNGRSSPGQMWGGGAGSEMAEDNAFHPDADQYSSLYGGGVLVLIVRGGVTIASGAIVSADASSYLASGGYGQAGGGFVGLYHSGALSNSGTIRADGAIGGGSPAGGSGGAGSTAVKTFTLMGW